MSRVIVAAAVIFAAAALVLHRAFFNGPFAEPVLLLTMGSFFLLSAKVCGAPKTAPEEHEEKTPVLVPERTRASA
jgi:hypothetical protein